MVDTALARQNGGAQRYKTSERITPAQVERECVACGRTLFVLPSSVQPRMFCNHRCFAAWKRTQKADSAGGWRGGIKISREGRIRFYFPEHPNADKHGYYSFHRWVAEQKIGRFLLPTEVVHHINGNPMDDDPENLLVLASESEHQRLHGQQRGGIQPKAVV